MHDSILFILTRDPENYVFQDAIYDSTGNIVIYTSYIDNNIKLLGVEVKNKRKLLYQYNVNNIYHTLKDNYYIIKFVNTDDDYLLKCSIETPIDSLPLYIYKDQNEKLIQIVLYEKNGKLEKTR